MKALVLAMVLCCLSCSDGNSLSARATSKTSAEQPAAIQPGSRLTLNPIDAAVEHLQALQNESDENARAALVSVYTDHGYAGAARFFRNTMREYASGEVGVEPPVAARWVGGDREVADVPRDVARRAADMTSAGNYRAAIDIAASEIEEHGSTMQLAAEWAHATLALSIEASEAVSPRAFEVAIRLLLTGLEEQAPRPRGVMSKADGYGLLARAFLVRGDRVSARTAAKLAMSDLRTEEVSESRNTAEQLLRSIIERTR